MEIAHKELPEDWQPADETDESEFPEVLEGR